MKKSGVYPFDNDITLNGGYLYTTNSILSSKLANERLTKATVEMVNLRNKRIIDVGCGDGSYTYELYKRYQPKQIVGIDASKNAIKLARALYAKKGVQFVLCSIYSLTKMFDLFDIAIVRGVIHHVEHPYKAIGEIAKIASEVVILEPNGYNPALKLIEKISLYHRIHKEKSYPPFKLRNWINLTELKIVKDQYVGFVPFFCPDGMAKTLNVMEPWIEKLPVFCRFLCGVYVILAKKHSHV